MIELGHGYTAEWFRSNDVRTGLIVTGPAAPACPHREQGRCGGAVFIEGHEPEDRPGWKLVSENPLTLDPSVKCGCDGQHLFVRDGHAELCDDDVAGER